MKKLILVRHAKSDWADGSLADYDRPLNARGMRDLTYMPSKLQALGEAPQGIYSSSALRAKMTAQAFADFFEINEHLVLDRDIYLASSIHLLDLVSRFSDDYQEAMMVGHNPGFSDLLSSFGSGEQYELPTLGIAVVSSPADSWSNFSTADAVVEHVIYPKLYDIQ